MALRSLMLNKSIAEKRSALAELEAVNFEVRESEIAKAIEEAATDEERSAVEEAITAFEEEKKDNCSKAEVLRSEIAALESELAEIEAAAPAETGEIEKPIEERKDDHRMNLMELRSSDKYINAYADYLKTGKDVEVRAMLTELADTTGMDSYSGLVPVPAFVDELIHTAWENDEIMGLVKKTYLKGVIKVGFEISATGAAWHNEGGERPEEEEIVLGIAELLPKFAKKYITISDECLSLNGSALIRYLYDELTYQIVKFVAGELIDHIADTVTVTAAGTSSIPGQPILKESPALGTVANAIATLADQASNPVIVMNKGTWATFKGIQYDGNFSVDPFEGLPIAFTSALPAVGDASEDDCYMIVGDLGRGVQANFPNGDEVRVIVDELSLAEYDLVKFVGKQYVALGIVTPNTLCRVTVAGE